MKISPSCNLGKFIQSLPCKEIVLKDPATETKTVEGHIAGYLGESFREIGIVTPFLKLVSKTSIPEDREKLEASTNDLIFLIFIPIGRGIKFSGNVVLDGMLKLDCQERFSITNQELFEFFEINIIPGSLGPSNLEGTIDRNKSAFFYDPMLDNRLIIHLFIDTDKSVLKFLNIPELAEVTDVKLLLVKDYRFLDQAVKKNKRLRIKFWIKYKDFSAQAFSDIRTTDDMAYTTILLPLGIAFDLALEFAGLFDITLSLSQLMAFQGSVGLDFRVKGCQSFQIETKLSNANFVAANLAIELEVNQKITLYGNLRYPRLFMKLDTFKRNGDTVCDPRYPWIIRLDLDQDYEGRLFNRGEEKDDEVIFPLTAIVPPNFDLPDVLHQTKLNFLKFWATEEADRYNFEGESCEFRFHGSALQFEVALDNFFGRLSMSLKSKLELDGRILCINFKSENYTGPQLDLVGPLENKWNFSANSSRLRFHSAIGFFPSELKTAVLTYTRNFLLDEVNVKFEANLNNWQLTATTTLSSPASDSEEQEPINFSVVCSRSLDSMRIELVWEDEESELRAISLLKLFGITSEQLGSKADLTVKKFRNVYEITSTLFLMKMEAQGDELKFNAGKKIILYKGLPIT